MDNDKAANPEKVSDDMATEVPDKQEDSFMMIGGVNVADMQAAYAAVPELRRWMSNSTKLIGDLYELVEAAQAANTQLEIKVAELEEAAKQSDSQE